MKLERRLQANDMNEVWKGMKVRECCSRRGQGESKPI